MREFEVLPVQRGERIIGPAPDEIRSVIARVDRLSEQVRSSDGPYLFYELERAVDDLEEWIRLYLGLVPDPEGEDPFAFSADEPSREPIRRDEMADYLTIEQRLSEVLSLQRRPVAVTFRETPPAGVPKFTGTAPSGCSFWRIAAGGRAFYTVPSDHYNCAIGSYTHNLPLPQDRAQELDQTLSFMAGIGYIKMEEVPGIPRLPQTPGVVIYAPLGDTPLDPDVVLFAGRPGRVMLLQEAAARAGVGAAPLLGRPTCMALPAALAQGVVASTSCIGNRVYTDLGEDELYVAVPGKDLAGMADALQTIVEANTTLEEYHRGRRQALATE
ncbi:MAG: DUF169 domain-containing protein [Candidatus Rokuibacteriota bacterium]